MNKDVKLIQQILKKKERGDLAELLQCANGEIDESSTYGSYLFSIISQYLFYLPLDDFHRARQLSDEDKKVLLDSVLYLYPHQAEEPEIRSIDFRVLREDGMEEQEIKVESKIEPEFAQEQLEKCEKKLVAEDYDGAISSSGSLLEDIFADIHMRCTGMEIDTTADLRIAYKKIKSLIRLSDDQYSSESAQAMMRGLSAIVSGLDALRNQMGDRHRRLAKPWKRHAKLCVNSTKVIVDFLYETLESQKQKLEAFYNELAALLDSSKRFFKKDELLLDREIIAYLSRCDEYLKSLLKDEFIKRYEINRFRDSDIFFSVMEIFFDQLSGKDVAIIFAKQKDNDQACGLEYFLGLVADEKSGLITPDITEYLESKKETIEGSEVDLPF